MGNLSGIMFRLLHIKIEFGDTAFEQASHAASIAIARSVLEYAERRAAEASRPPCVIIPLILVSATNDEE